MTTDELSESITAVAPSDTRILTIKMINPNPETARDIADTLRELVSNQLTSVMNVDSVNTIENASLPVKPISPDVARYTLLGFVIGVLAAFIYFIVSFIYDDTVKTPDDIEQKARLHDARRASFNGKHQKRKETSEKDRQSHIS